MASGSDLIGVLLVLLVCVVGNGNGNGVMGQQVPDCVGKVLPCSNYLNSTSPPESCCSPLREAFEKEMSCLCGLFNNRESFKSFGLNLTQILELPKRCAINFNLDVCNNPGPSPSPSPAFAVPPSAVSGSNMAKVGMAGLMGMLLLASTIM